MIPLERYEGAISPIALYLAANALGLPAGELAGLAMFARRGSPGAAATSSSTPKDHRERDRERELKRQSASLEAVEKFNDRNAKHTSGDVAGDTAAELERQRDVENAVAEFNAENTAELERRADESDERRAATVEAELERERELAENDPDLARQLEAREAVDEFGTATIEASAEAREQSDERELDTEENALADANAAATRAPEAQERSSRRRETLAISSVREVAGDSREIEGIAVPYGAVALATENGSEAFAPGAFRDSVNHWMTRTDGARMAFRPAHKEKPVGTITHLEDSADGVRFRASIFSTPAGDEYLAEVRAGLNGVSVEFGPGTGAASRRARDGSLIHRSAMLHAIAGSIAPAYDAARISLRDMQEVAAMNKCPNCDAELELGVGHECPNAPGAGDPPADDRKAASATAGAAGPGASTGAAAATAGRSVASSSIAQLTPAERSALERADISRLRPLVRQMSAERVYHRDSEFTFLADNWQAAAYGDSDARGRQQKHAGLLSERAAQMERDAVWRLFSGEAAVSERAGDVLSSEIPGAYPNDYLPGLLTPRILKGRPMGGFFDRIPIADARPRIFPKVTTSTVVAVQSAEGAALSSTDFATTAVTATPLMYGAFTDVSRQTLDGGDPAALAMIMQDLNEAYSQVSEGVIKTAVEAGSTASGVAITAATPYAGAIANVVNYYTTRFKTAQRAFIPPAGFSTLLAQADTTGRPLVPQIGPVNSDGSVSTGGDRIVAPLLSAQGELAWQATVNVWVFSVPSDFVIYESAIAQFSYDQVVGPQAVRVGIWAYLVVGTRLGSLKVTAA